MAAVARHHYLDGRSKVEIAEALGISRFQVARLLTRARETGVVRIEIGDQGALDLDASTRLQDAFGLRHVVVVDATVEQPAPLRLELGAVAADLLTEVVRPDDVLGVAWARAVSAMASCITSLPGVPVVQLTGSLSCSGLDDSSVELVRRLARVSGAPGHYFYAPMVVPDAATARALRQQPEVARAFGLVPEVTTAVIGIGLWSRGESTLYEAASEDDRQALQALGVRAEFCGVLTDAEGALVHAPLSERMVAVSAAQLAAVPEVVAIAYGALPAPAGRQRVTADRPRRRNSPAGPAAVTGRPAAAGPASRASPGS
jgi:DNA-binding transcriptional regulator LsrR (DeoR family)